VILLGLNLYTLALLDFSPTMGSQDWRSVALFLGPRLATNDAVLVQPGMFSATLAFYLGRHPLPPGVHLQAITVRPSPTLLGTGRVWLIDAPAHSIVGQYGLTSWLTTSELGYRIDPSVSMLTSSFFPANRIRVQLFTK